MLQYKKMKKKKMRFMMTIKYILKKLKEILIQKNFWKKIF